MALGGRQALTPGPTLSFAGCREPRATHRHRAGVWTVPPRHSSKPHRNEGLNPCQPGFVTIEDSLCWHSLVQAAGHGSSFAMQGLQLIARGWHSSLPATAPAHIHLRLCYGAGSCLLGPAVAAVGISARKVEMCVFVGTSMVNAMGVIIDNILCNKYHCQDNASRFICHALEN